MNSALIRLFLAAVAGLLLLAGCSSGDDSTSATTTTVAAVEASAEDTTTTIDTRTDEEIVIDRLDLMMFDLGITDLETASNCVVERLESENIELTGEGTSELIAVFGCNEGALARWLPPTNPALSTEAWTCTVESIGDWINALTIPEAQAFFEAEEPPVEFIDLAAFNCNVSADELVAAF